MGCKTWFSLVALAGTVLATPPGGTEPGGGPTVIEFVCTDTPELCNNMCWGAFCTDQGNGPIGQTLTYDAPSPDTTKARYKKACQTPKNRCSGNGDYNSCDEYPMKVTSDADRRDAVSRCVTPNAQSIQGGKISAFTRKHGAGDQFLITFGNPGDAKFCESTSDCDNSDGAEWQNGGPAPNPKNGPKNKRHYYLTARGTELASAVELPVGKRVTSFDVNQTAVEGNVRRLGKRDHWTEYQTVDNEVVEYLFSV